MAVGYLVNQYPKVSHTFIRREIAALERRGLPVRRFALRGWDDTPPDPADVAEQQRTTYVLRGGMLPLLGAALRTAVRHPVRFGRALATVLRVARTGRRSTAHHLAWLAEACWLLPRLRDVDHLHVHFATNGALVAWLAHRLGGPPFSLTVHGPEEFDHVGALALPELLANARFAVAISAYGRSQLWRWMPAARWDRVHVVHCGLERDWLQAVPTPPPAAPRLVCVGRLCEQKGQLLLIDAAARVAATGRRFELVLVGDGEMRADIEARIGALGLGGQVRITGWVGADGVRREIEAARALVLPSFAEGLPVVLMEAMALGRPVLTTWIAGVPELVLPGQTGWLFAAGDPDALVQAMTQVLDAAPADLAAMGRAAHARVAQRHDIDDSARALQALLTAPGAAP